MLTSRSEPIYRGRGIRFVIEEDSSSISYADVIQKWRHDSVFRDFFIELLKRAPFGAFRWETPPITAESAGRAFEFVLMDSPEIALSPDPAAFEQYFDASNPESIVEFPNLGGDAILVVPGPTGRRDDFGHLASYLLGAPESQQHALWEQVGAAMQRRIGTKPVWLNTAGGGVAWLHVRLDDRPKYYAYEPYRRSS